MRILIVDDEQIICEGMAAILAAIPDMNLEIRDACNAVEGKRLLRSFRPDLMISDVEMPGENGLELAAYAKECVPGIRVLMLSGHDDYSYVRGAFMLQVDDYLLKPIDISQVQDMIREYYLEFECGDRIERIEAIFRSYCPAPEETAYSPRLRDIMEYIRKNIAQDISLGKLADVFACSETLIGRLFRQETGRTFMEFVNEVRLRQAFRALLLAPRRSMQSISLDLGYASERQFFRVFKSMTGITPTQLREKHGPEVAGSGEKEQKQNYL